MSSRRSSRSVLLACLVSALLLAGSAGVAISRTHSDGSASITGPAGDPPAASLPTACGPGHAWIAGSKGGVACLDTDGWTSYNGGWGSFPGGRVADIAVCRDGTSWLATTSGLVSTKGRTWVNHAATRYTSFDAVACGAKKGVWLAGYKAVSYYDGKKLTKHAASKLGTGEYVNLVKDVAVAPDGHVWVATSNSVATYDGSRWTYFEKGRGFDADYYFERIAVDGGGRVWVAAGSSGLLVYDGTAWTVLDEPFLSMSQALAADARGRLWVGTHSHGVSVLDGQEWTTYDRSNSELPDNAVGSLSTDANGRAWIGTDWGLAVLDGSDWTVYHMSDSSIPDDEITAMAVAAKGPDLPAPVPKKPGALKGRIVRSGTAQAGLPVEICAGYLGMFYFGATPCSNQPNFRSTTTDASGRFAFSRVPAGWYSITFHPPGGKWTTLSSTFGLGSSQKLVSAGKTTDVGTIDLAKGD